MRSVAVSTPVDAQLTLEPKFSQPSSVVATKQALKMLFPAASICWLVPPVVIFTLMTDIGFNRESKVQTKEV